MSRTAGVADLLSPWFGASAAAELVPSFRRESFAKGEALLAMGEVWRHATVIEQGLVRLHFVRRDGREFNKNFYAERALICPLTPAMWSHPSLFGMACIEPAVVWRAPALPLYEALQAHGLWAALRTELLDRLVTHKLQREHDLLALDGRARYQTFCERQPMLAGRVPLVHLASYLGLTDVSLSRIRRTRKQERKHEP